MAVEGEGADGTPFTCSLEPAGHGWFEGRAPGIGAGARYRFRLPDGRLLPDPASRFQPEGVHGPSMVIDPAAFAWSDHGWRGVRLEDLVVYELHVGTFTPAGTFDGVVAQLPYLRDLGVTALELMPVADFPGSRNWGYDGAALFAPARCYGPPDALRRLVDGAHRLGLAVLLDVVYNHVGPDGAYLNAFSPFYFTDRHRSPWGAGVNLDGEGADQVRAFFIENALHWVHEYHVDGLRLDATHAIEDGGPRHFLAELAGRVKRSAPDREVLVIAEDSRNLARIVTPTEHGGWGLDAVWADDLHHQLRRRLAGDTDGYYQDYRGTTTDIATTIRQGWFFTGQHSDFLAAPRGTAPSGVPPRRSVVCVQNHDQVGNRAFGDRLHHRIDPAAYRAVSALLLVVPETPLLFMGQEWAASSPFLFFTDHHAELGRLVTEGRRREFARFAAFADAATRARIPDPQVEQTFAASRLDWHEQAREPHAGTRRLYAALLALRRQRTAFRAGAAIEALALDGATLAVRRTGPEDTVLAVVRLEGAGTVDLAPATGTPHGGPAVGPGVAWTALLHTEDARFTADAEPPVYRADRGPVVEFARPSAILFASRLS
jgi:maltooligosyltrehalose trehalohydrolase